MFKKQGILYLFCSVLFMKHSVLVIIILLSLFFVSQVVGLLITQAYIDVVASAKGGFLVWKSLPAIGVLSFERPVMSSVVVPWYVLFGVFVGTFLVFMLVRFRQMWLWKLWFFLAMFLCMYVSFFTFLNETAAIVIAFTAAFLKVFRPSLIIHNLTEMFVYGGLAAIFVPLLDLFSVVVLLILIALYDAYAVWKSQHMIALAKFQMKAKVFAGLLVPYELPKKVRKGVHKKVRIALLGGGDIAFPLLFSGVIMTSFGFLPALIVSLTTSIALFLLLYLGQKDKFYPAMPFLAAGCFVGYGIVLLI